MPALYHYSSEEPQDKELFLKKQWIALQRLLYCMERPVQRESDDDDPISWQSLLLRAQHCQELWQQVLQAEGAEMDPSLQLKVSHRVDQACRRAFETAEIQRQQHLQQTNAQDLIDRIFFSEEKKEEANDDDDDDPYDGLLDDEDDQVDESVTERSYSNHHHHHGTPSMSLEELQKAQREQMEEAIGLMAEQMKQATQGIQNQIRQQTAKTLTELETVAEQNVQDVTAVAQNVQQHNRRQQQRNWGTWTLIFTVVGVFLFCLVTIFTIPKRPNTCLIFCGREETSLVGWLSQPVRVVSKVIGVPASQFVQKLFSGGDGMDETDYDTSDFQHREEWDKIYNEDEVERREKEKLDQLLNSLHKKEVPKKETPKDKKTDWRQAMEDGDESDGDPFGGRKPEKKKSLDDDVQADPLSGRKAVKKQPRDDEIKDDPFSDRKPVKKATADANIDDDPFGGRKPVQKDTKKKEPSSDKKREKSKSAADPSEDDDPFGGRQPAKKQALNSADPSGKEQPVKTEPKDESKTASAEILPNGELKDVKDEQAAPKVPEKVQDINMADLLASLNQAAKKTQQEELEAASFKRKGANGPLPGVDLFGDLGDAQAAGSALEREGTAKRRVSPKDIRNAADLGDVDKLKDLLELQPDFVNRKDRNQWTPLHLAARSGHTGAVRLLHERGASLTLENNRGRTALDEAISHLGTEHETVRLLRRLGGKDDDANDHPSDGDVVQPSLDVSSKAESSKLSKFQAKQEALRLAMEMRDDADDLEMYVEAGRKKLEKLQTDLPAIEKLNVVLEVSEDDENHNLYVQAGRDRLEAILLKTNQARVEL